MDDAEERAERRRATKREYNRRWREDPANHAHRKEYNRRYREDPVNHARARERYQQNRDARRRVATEYRDANPEAVRARLRAWQNQNKDYLADYQRNYRRDNPEQYQKALAANAARKRLKNRLKKLELPDRRLHKTAARERRAAQAAAEEFFTRRRTKDELAAAAQDLARYGFRHRAVSAEELTRQQRDRRRARTPLVAKAVVREVRGRLLRRGTDLELIDDVTLDSRAREARGKPGYDIPAEVARRMNELVKETAGPEIIARLDDMDAADLKRLGEGPVVRAHFPEEALDDRAKRLRALGLPVRPASYETARRERRASQAAADEFFARPRTRREFASLLDREWESTAASIERAERVTRIVAQRMRARIVRGKSQQIEADLPRRGSGSSHRLGTGRPPLGSTVRQVEKLVAREVGDEVSRRLRAINADSVARRRASAIAHREAQQATPARPALANERRVTQHAADEFFSRTRDDRELDRLIRSEVEHGAVDMHRYIIRSHHLANDIFPAVRSRLEETMSQRVLEEVTRDSDARQAHGEPGYDIPDEAARRMDLLVARVAAEKIQRRIAQLDAEDRAQRVARFPQLDRPSLPPQRGGADLSR